MALIIFKQMLVMMIYIIIGFFLYREKLVVHDGVKSFANVLIYVIIPCVVIQSFINKTESTNIKTFFTMFIISVILLLISMAISLIVFKNRKIDSFGCSFSNAAFLGIPVITASLGSEYVFYTTSFIALLNMLQWLFSIMFFKDKTEKIHPLEIIKHPLISSFLIGLILFILNIKLPSLVINTISSIAITTGPIAMILLGIYLADIKYDEIFKDKIVFKVSLFRLLIIPIISMLFLYFIPIDIKIKLALLISVSAPVGSNVAMYAHLYGGDYKHAVKIVCISTIFSIISLPFIMMIATNYLK